MNDYSSNKLVKLYSNCIRQKKIKNSCSKTNNLLYNSKILDKNNTYLINNSVFNNINTSTNKDNYIKLKSKYNLSKINNNDSSSDSSGTDNSYACINFDEISEDDDVLSNLKYNNHINLNKFVSKKQYDSLNILHRIKDKLNKKNKQFSNDMKILDNLSNESLSIWLRFYKMFFISSFNLNKHNLSLNKKLDDKISISKLDSSTVYCSKKSLNKLKYCEQKQMSSNKLVQNFDEFNILKHQLISNNKNYIHKLKKKVLLNSSSRRNNIIKDLDKFSSILSKQYNILNLDFLEKIKRLSKINNNSNFNLTNDRKLRNIRYKLNISIYELSLRCLFFKRHNINNKKFNNFKIIANISNYIKNFYNLNQLNNKNFNLQSKDYYKKLTTKIKSKNCLTSIAKKSFLNSDVNNNSKGGILRKLNTYKSINLSISKLSNNEISLRKTKSKKVNVKMSYKSLISIDTINNKSINNNTIVYLTNKSKNRLNNSDYKNFYTQRERYSKFSSNYNLINNNKNYLSNTNRNKKYQLSTEKIKYSNASLNYNNNSIKNTNEKYEYNSNSNSNSKKLYNFNNITDKLSKNSRHLLDKCKILFINS